MEQVSFYDLPYITGASATTLVYIGGHDQLLLNISAVASKFASGTVIFTVQGTHNSGLSARTHYYYDYVCPAPAEAKITATTGGFYEVPFGGGIPYIKIAFNTAATGAGTLVAVFPRIA